MSNPIDFIEDNDDDFAFLKKDKSESKVIVNLRKKIDFLDSSSEDEVLQTFKKEEKLTEEEPIKNINYDTEEQKLDKSSWEDDTTEIVTTKSQESNDKETNFVSQLDETVFTSDNAQLTQSAEFNQNFSNKKQNESIFDSDDNDEDFFVKKTVNKEKEIDKQNEIKTKLKSLIETNETYKTITESLIKFLFDHKLATEYIDKLSKNDKNQQEFVQTTIKKPKIPSPVSTSILLEKEEEPEIDVDESDKIDEVSLPDNSEMILKDKLNNLHLNSKKETDLTVIKHSPETEVNEPNQLIENKSPVSTLPSKNQIKPKVFSPLLVRKNLSPSLPKTEEKEKVPAKESRNSRSFADLFELGEDQADKQNVIMGKDDNEHNDNFNLLEDENEEATSVISSIFGIFKKKKQESPQIQPKVFKKQEIQKPSKERVVSKNSYAGKKEVNICIPGIQKKTK